ncbi:hypothetical protein ETD86_40440 [Nonomuraea turkmeniaca]|uniref:Uncharacterized protein n=1 Tax=Nonomuraea turkmeniaca TaxID=103838 RepID=A0A5S4F2X7_9ACTN|nr:hypothetical protein [Nonomuraea turkmeniaca]TMR10246.1 hypothetical protein ETD86_40440 [Nonomuraea turkmeniaca]
MKPDDRHLHSPRIHLRGCARGEARPPDRLHDRAEAWAGTLAIDWHTHKVVEPLKRHNRTWPEPPLWVIQCEREVFFSEHEHAGVPFANPNLMDDRIEGGGA